MAKSVLNIAFVTRANSHYARAGFARRSKGQRKMADLLPLFLHGDDLQGYAVTLLGVGRAYNGSGRVVPCQHLLVVTPAGQCVPAYRLCDFSYNICQELNYVPA